MPVEVAAGPTLKSTVNLPSETQNGDGDGDPAAAYDEMNDDKLSIGFNLLQSIKEEDDKGEEEEAIMSGSDDTCSIGECSSADDDDDETREDEVQSKQSDHQSLQIKSNLTSLHSLEDSLPIKRGLSNFYSGKSKSFTSLSNAANATAKDLVKPENPLNKRRRLLIAWSRNRRASCSSLVSIAESESPLMPLQRLPSVVSECEEEEEEEEVEESLEQDESSSSFSPSERMRRDKEKRRPSLFTVTVAPAEVDHDHVLSSISIGKMALRSPGRSLSLSDLNRHAHAHAMTNLD
ncbi:glucosidase 2 subunit beta [Carex littledalei]|uniref:Glucosidase 2 subunit beta n=1 Tax=Carex littledalei TaxID=544730 RepID=A0A833QZ30_9POAL|nr:glucosidase 2 subunit beta [Carex littledalei]